MAKITIKYGEDVLAIVDDPQAAAQLMQALRGKKKAAQQKSAPSTPATPISPKPANHFPYRPPSPLQDAVKRALTTGPQTTRQLIEKMEASGYGFTAKDKIIAMNSALAILEERGEAEVHSTVAGTNQKLWTKAGGLKAR